VASLLLHLSSHRLGRGQGVAPNQEIADQLCLRFGQRHGGAQGLQQADEEEVVLAWPGHPPPQRQVVTWCCEELRVEEGEADLVAGAVDDRDGFDR
jgi:hypothetical protein